MALLARDPSPISIAPSQLWYGNDGPWSPFVLGYGSPPQYVKSLISTSTPQPYVVIPGGCIDGDASDCSVARGGYFYSNQSSSWKNYGNYALMFEQNLGIYDAGNFGLDTITLGVPGSGAPSMNQQIVVGIVAKDFFLGTWGLRPAATNFTDINNPVPSFLQNLKTSGQISSLSWAYSAGSYQIGQVNKHGQGSLTIGGYDSARFEANNVTFDFAADTNRDLVVAVVSIGLADGSNSLLPSPILSFLDSAVSQIWLPKESCDRFQQAFDLTYDDDLGLYTINETVHQSLLKNNASVAFTLSNDLSISSESTPVTINLPYSAFDLQLSQDYPGLLQNSTYYFPIRQAANESQYTLGRTFFQHAYVIADYERNTFSVHQASFPTNGEQNLQSILSPSSVNSTASVATETSTHLSTGIIAGVVVGAVFAVALLLFAGLWIQRKTTHKRKTEQQPLIYEKNATPDINGDPDSVRKDWELHSEAKLRPEMPSEARFNHKELPTIEVAQELASSSEHLSPQDPQHAFHKQPPVTHWEMPS